VVALSERAEWVNALRERHQRRPAQMRNQPMPVRAWRSAAYRAVWIEPRTATAQLTLANAPFDRRIIAGFRGRRAMTRSPNDRDLIPLGPESDPVLEFGEVLGDDGPTEAAEVLAWLKCSMMGRLP
jgi:hypothetical protein